TLVDDTEATRETVTLTLQAARLPAGHEAVDNALRHIRKRWARHPHRHTGPLTCISAWEALWLPTESTGLPKPVTESLAIHERQVWEAVLPSLGGDAHEAPATAATFRRLRHSLLRPLPGAHDALNILGRRHSLWLATNGLPIHQRAKLVATGL